MNQLNNKAVALLSGGLDSRLAVKLMVEQGIDITCLNMVGAFCTCSSKNSCRSEARKAASDLNLPIKVKNNTMALIEIVKNPKHGFGKNLNPCIDCRLLLLKEAKKVVDEIGASFLITGDVLGSRPMSQRMESLQLIEKESGLEGLILRPLSAKLLPPTLPEKAGIIDRQKLLDFHGRSRKPQMELAEEINMTDYPCPAGGCLLTDRDFSDRLRSFLKMVPKPTMKEIFLLKYGRHFLIDDHKVIIGRNESDNKMISKLASENDIIIKISGYEGPTGLIQSKVKSQQSTGIKMEDDQVNSQQSAGIVGNGSVELIKKAASIVARYSKGREEAELTAMCWTNNVKPETITVKPTDGLKIVDNLNNVSNQRVY